MSTVSVADILRKQKSSPGEQIDPFGDDDDDVKPRKQRKQKKIKKASASRSDDVGVSNSEQTSVDFESRYNNLLVEYEALKKAKIAGESRAQEDISRLQADLKAKVSIIERLEKQLEEVDSSEEASEIQDLREELIVKKARIQALELDKNSSEQEVSKLVDEIKSLKTDLKRSKRIGVSESSSQDDEELIRSRPFLLAMKVASAIGEKNRLLAVATAILENQGKDGLSLTEIKDLTGIDKPSKYTKILVEEKGFFEKMPIGKAGKLYYKMNIEKI